MPAMPLVVSRSRSTYTRLEAQQRDRLQGINAQQIKSEIKYRVVHGEAGVSVTVNAVFYKRG